MLVNDAAGLRIPFMLENVEESQHRVRRRNVVVPITARAYQSLYSFVGR